MGSVIWPCDVPWKVIMGRAAALPYQIKIGRAEVRLRPNFPTLGDESGIGLTAKYAKYAK